MKRVVLYIRVSTAEQVEGTSLESQERVCREFCRKEDMEVVEVFSDRGESAKTADRPALQAMLRYTTNKKNRIDFIVAYRLDRVARNNHDFVIFSATLAKYGVAIRSATEPAVNDDDPTGRFMTTVLSAVAQLDNDIRGLRSAEGMRRVTEKGGWAFQAPTGYLRARNEDKLPILKEDPQKGPLVRMMFEDIAKGLVREQDLPKKMSALGLLTDRGGTLHVQTVFKILRNPIYAGVICHSLNNNQWQMAAFPGLVSEETFNRVRMVLEGKGHTATPHRRFNEHFPLRNSVRCAACSTQLTASFSTGRSAKYPYYRCRNKECQAVNIRKSDLEMQFAEHLSSVTETALPQLNDFAKRVLEHWNQLLAANYGEQQVVKDQVEKKEQQQRRLLEKLVQGVIKDEAYEAMNAQLDADIAVLKADRQYAAMEEDDIQGILNAATHTLRNAQRIWFALSGENQVRFQRVLFPDGLAYSPETGFGTAANHWLFNSLQEIQVEKLQVAPPSGFEPLFPG